MSDKKANANAMTPKVDKASAADTKLTDREIEILGKAWNCMKNQPEIDMPKLAEKLGMTNVGSATNAWGRIKKKLFTDLPPAPANGNGGDGAGTTPTPRKRKPKSERFAHDSGSDAGAPPATPTKKAKKTPGRKRKSAAATTKVEDDGGEGVKNEAQDDDASKVKKEEPEMADVI